MSLPTSAAIDVGLTIVSAAMREYAGGVTMAVNAPGPAGVARWLPPVAPDAVTPARPARSSNGRPTNCVTKYSATEDPPA